jgi:hypothetical protein
MRRLASALILMAAALPMAPASAANTLAIELQPFAFLAGSCWRGSFPGGQMTDTHCFSPILHGHFLRDRHIVNNAPDPYLGETIYRWDAATRNIRWDYYSSDGMLMSGSAAGTDGGISFVISAVSPAGASPIAERIAWRRDGADAYVVTTEVRENGVWRSRPNAMHFQRIGPAPAD